MTKLSDAGRKPVNASQENKNDTFKAREEERDCSWSCKNWVKPHAGRNILRDLVMFVLWNGRIMPLRIIMRASLISPWPPHGDSCPPAAVSLRCHLFCRALC